MSRPQGINDLQISWAIRDCDIPFKCKALLWGLLSIIGNRVSCYYDYSQLCKILRISERSLREGLKELESLEFIQIKRPPKKGRGYANEYILNYHNLIKPAKSAGFLGINRQNPPASGQRSRQKTSQKPAKFADQEIKKEIQKKREEFFKKLPDQKQNTPLSKIDQELEVGESVQVDKFIAEIRQQLRLKPK